MDIRFNTIASTVAFVCNSVQTSECLQLVLTGHGSSPLDQVVPPKYRRLAAALQIPVLACMAGGELAKVRKAVDG